MNYRDHYVVISEGGVTILKNEWEAFPHEIEAADIRDCQIEKYVWRDYQKAVPGFLLFGIIFCFLLLPVGLYLLFMAIVASHYKQYKHCVVVCYAQKPKITTFSDVTYVSTDIPDKHAYFGWYSKGKAQNMVTNIRDVSPLLTTRRSMLERSLASV